MKIRSVAAVAVAVIITAFSFTVSAETPFSPYTDYTYKLGYNEKTYVQAKPMYEVDTVLSGSNLGYTDFNNPSSVFCDGNGDVYILEESTSRITVLGSDKKVKKTITAFTASDGTVYEFSAALGIYVTSDLIYVADSGNSRVLAADKNGILKMVSELPESSLIPDDFIYTPTRVAVDKKGYMYVLSSGSTYGALLFDPKGDFQGFYGANKVSATLSGVLASLWDNWFASDEQLAGRVQKIPYQFTDICLDSNDFVYTVTGATDTTETDQTAQIRCLSPAGANILKVKQTEKYSDSDSFNFGDIEIAPNSSGTGYRLQNFTGITVDKNGYIYALDATYGRIYVYDKECNLLVAFGGGTGAGEQHGLFQTANSIAVSDDFIFVSDSTLNTITVFKRNDYGTKVMKADNLYLAGNYTEAKDLWLEINRFDPNSQLSYYGLARAYLIENDYENALYYAEKGLDYSTYNQAYSYIRNEKLKNNFAVILTVAGIVIIGIIAAVIVMKKKNVKLAVNPKLSVLLRISVHPFDSANKIKYSGMGSTLLATGVLALFYIFKVLGITMGGFLHTQFNPQSYNAVYTLLGSAGIVLLWVLCNWAIAVLFNGKCKLRETYVVACYAMIPQIISNILFLILSNILVFEESAVLSAISVICLILSGIILCIGTMIINEFSFFGFAGTAIVTVLAMGIIIFVLLMVLTLDQQLITFVQSVFKEVWYR